MVHAERPSLTSSSSSGSCIVFGTTSGPCRRASDDAVQLLTEAPALEPASAASAATASAAAARRLGIVGRIGTRSDDTEIGRKKRQGPREEAGPLSMLVNRWLLPPAS